MLNPMSQMMKAKTAKPSRLSTQRTEGKRFTGGPIVPSHSSPWQPDDLTEPHKPPRRRRVSELSQLEYRRTGTSHCPTQLPCLFLLVCERERDWLSPVIPLSKLDTLPCVSSCMTV